MLLGTQYWRPPTPYGEFWEDDHRRMADAGFNAVKHWAFWTWHHPSPEAFQFDELDGLFELAASHGLSVVLQMVLCNAPEWAFERLPEARFVSADGFVVPSTSISNSNVGGFPGLCFDNEGARELAAPFVAALVERYRGHRALAAYDLWNEPHIEGLRDPHGWDTSARRTFCYCPASVERFRRWLGERHGSLAGVNSAWNRHYGSWDQVAPPVRPGSLVEWVEWRLFWLENLADTLGWMAETARGSDRGHPVMTHAGGNSCLCQDIGMFGADDWQLARRVDEYGVSIWDIDDFVVASAALDAVRCAADGRPHLVSECYFGPRGGCDQIGTEASSQTIEQSAWLYAMKGASGILHWQYRTEMVGWESPNYGLLTLSGEPRAAHGALGRAFQEIGVHQEVLQRTSPPAAEVAMLFSPESYLVEWAASQSVEASRSSLLGTYRALQRQVNGIDIIHSTTVGEGLDRYAAVVLPSATMLTERAAGELASHVEAGGMVIGLGGTGLRDDWARCYREVPGGAMARVFGCITDDIASGDDELTIEYLGESFRLPGRRTRQALSVLDNGQAIGSLRSGEAGAVRGRWGAGEAIYLGVDIDARHSDEWTRFLGRVLAERAVRPRFGCDDPQMLCLHREGSDGWLLMVANLEREPRSAVVSTPGAVEVQPVAGVTCRLEDGGLRFGLPARGLSVVWCSRAGAGQ